MSNKNTVSYEAKFLKKIFSKLSHQAGTQKVEIGGTNAAGGNSGTKETGAKYPMNKKELPSP